MDFEEAIARVQTLSSKLSKEHLLKVFQFNKLYGLYKTATVGKCNISQPGYFDFQARAKYDSWKSIDHLDTEEAKRLYIAQVLELDGTPLKETKSTGFAVSTMDHPDAELEYFKFTREQDKTMFDHVKEGSVDKLKNVLNADTIAALDDQVYQFD
jgi:acyl-CoA-binding protein